MPHDLFEALDGRLLNSGGIRDTRGFLGLGELKERVRGLGAALMARGVRVLAVQADNGVEWVVADLACQAHGIVHVPLPPFFSPAQIRHVLETSGAQGLLADAPGLLQEAGLQADKLVLDASPLALYALPPAREPQPMPTGTGKLTYTSGSTGWPKGVCLGNPQLMMQAMGLAIVADIPRPRHLCLLPLAVLLENLAGVYAPLLAGGEVLLPRAQELGMQGSRLARPDRFLDLIARSRPQTLILTPQLLLMLTGAAREGWVPPRSLAFVAVGGARVAPELILDARRHGIPAYEGYGLSECVSVVTLNTPGDDKPGSCGKPLPHQRVRVKDGEILIEGALMLGYLGERDTWHRPVVYSGDLGHLDAEGFLHVEGRRKNLLISSYGRNISPEWVESELLAGGPLAEAVVVGDARPCCAALVYSRGEEPATGIQAWIDHVNRRLPDYARIVRWHRLESPLAGDGDLCTANGRPRREAIARRFAHEIKALYAQTGGSAPTMKPPSIQVKP